MLTKTIARTASALASAQDAYAALDTEQLAVAAGIGLIVTLLVAFAMGRRRKKYVRAVTSGAIRTEGGKLLTRSPEHVRAMWVREAQKEWSDMRKRRMLSYAIVFVLITLLFYKILVTFPKFYKPASGAPAAAGPPKTASEDYETESRQSSSGERTPPRRQEGGGGGESGYADVLRYIKHGEPGF